LVACEALAKAARNVSIVGVSFIVVSGALNCFWIERVIASGKTPPRLLVSAVREIGVPLEADGNHLHLAFWIRWKKLVAPGGEALQRSVGWPMLHESRDSEAEKILFPVIHEKKERRMA
jgi:hypothetical protein